MCCVSLEIVAVDDGMSKMARICFEHAEKAPDKHINIASSWAIRSSSYGTQHHYDFLRSTLSTFDC